MSTQPPRPNLILITTDQQRFDTIHRLGQQAVFTPNLDYLCDQGVAFTNATADCPICVPSRATIMTARHGFRQGLTANAARDPMPYAEHPTLPGLLRQVGYQTRAIGKMHFHPMRAHYGFDHMELPYDYLRERRRFGGPVEQPMAHGMSQNDTAPGFSTVPENLSLTHWIAERSAEFLATRDPTRPFFLWTSFTKPHPPLDCDPNYWALYGDIDLPSAVTDADWHDGPSTLPAGFAQPTRMLNQLDTYRPDLVRAVRRAYYASLTQVDYNLGLLLGGLREHGLLGNTWIVFTADHGEMLGDHHMAAKATFFAGSARVPMIVRPPSAPFADATEAMGRRSDALACLADVMPTFLSRAGVDLPEGIDGIDLMAQAGLADGPARTRDQLPGRCGEQLMLQRGPLKATCAFHDPDARLVFDVHEDPYDQRDLLRAGRPEAAELMDELLAFGREQEPQHQPEAHRPGWRWPGHHRTDHPCDVLH